MLPYVPIKRSDGRHIYDSSAVYASAAHLEDSDQCLSTSESGLAVRSDASGRSRGSIRKKRLSGAASIARITVGSNAECGTSPW